VGEEKEIRDKKLETGWRGEERRILFLFPHPLSFIRLLCRLKLIVLITAIYLTLYGGGSGHIASVTKAK